MIETQHAKRSKVYIVADKFLLYFVEQQILMWPCKQKQERLMGGKSARVYSSTK